MVDNFLIPDFGHVKDDFFDKVAKKRDIEEEKPIDRKLSFGFIAVNDMTYLEFVEWIDKYRPF